LLQGGDKRLKLKDLMSQRYPTYAEADLTVDTGDEPPDSTVQKVYDALANMDAPANNSAAAE
jgi:shikimate kinase